MKENTVKKLSPALQDDLFQEGKNCWKTANASYASVIIDCASYYRNVHEAIVKARHSVFILGWDIDGRVELLRGEEATKSPAPTRLFDLIKWKTEQDPHVKFYLNSWDYALVFSTTREPFFNLHWDDEALKDKVYFCFDDLIPLGACHHQKIIIVDDEIAYNGGMDIAYGRWDTRDHAKKNPCRKDQAGFQKGGMLTECGPYHDIQMVASGEAASILNDVVRARWANVSDIKPAAKRDIDFSVLPPTWPDNTPPEFENIEMAVSRTQPEMGTNKEVREVEEMYLDRIARAEQFIYIENQYLACEKVAEALNARLKEAPDLRALIVSSYKSPSVMENNSMWPGRIKFRRLVEQDIDKDRVTFASPFSHGEKVHIHSKFMVVDDQYISIGSANLNNRSMGFDTECDVILQGNTPEQRKKIEDIRNDLIREHMGMEAAEIQHIIESGQKPGIFLKRIPDSQYFRRFDDEKFARRSFFSSFLLYFTDPPMPIIPEPLVMHSRHSNAHRTFSQRVKYSLMLAVIALIVVALWRYTPLSTFANTKEMSALMDSLALSPSGFLIVMGIFVIGGFLFFPVTIMIAATAATFGPLTGFFFAMAGSLLSASISYMVGNALGTRYLQKIFGNRFRVVAKQIKTAGAIGVTLLRLTPIAPFTVINLALGVSNIAFVPYIAGTFLGLLPGIITLAFVGDSFAELFHDASLQNYLYVGLGVFVWLLALVGVHFAAKKIQDKFMPVSS